MIDRVAFVRGSRESGRSSHGDESALTRAVRNKGDGRVIQPPKLSYRSFGVWFLVIEVVARLIVSLREDWDAYVLQLVAARPMRPPILVRCTLEIVNHHDSIRLGALRLPETLVSDEPFRRRRRHAVGKEFIFHCAVIQ